MVFIFLKLDFMFLKLDLTFLKLFFIFLKLDFSFLKLDFIFLNLRLKRCSDYYIDFYVTIRPFDNPQNIQITDVKTVFQTLSGDKQTQMFYHNTVKQASRIPTWFSVKHAS